mmetsp:Transcript_15603/g.33816  ORF Transcript_15603/g.33816 Transcript_15603/m.33816 type:complete len:481 (-) Transcript_15603:455-1897(-)
MPPLGRSARSLLVAPADAHGQPRGGVDGGARLHADVLLRARQLEAVLVQEVRQHHCGLHDRKLVPHALADAAAEGQVGEVRGNLVGVEPLNQARVEAPPPLHLRVLELGLPAHGVEGVGLVPERLGAVQVPHRNEDVRALEQLDLLVGGGLRQLHLLHGAPDQQGGLGVQPQRLRDGVPHQLQARQLLVLRPRAVAHHLVHLGLHLRHDLGVGGEEERRPREHGGGGLVPGHQHGHQVVAQLLVGRLLPAQVHQEPQQRRVLHLFVVHVLEVLEVRGGAALVCLADELSQHVVDQLQVRLEPSLPRHHQAGAGDVPVGEVEGGAVLRLAQHVVHGLDHGGLLLHAAKVVVEHRLADDVQRHAAELRLHVQHLLLVCRLAELVGEDVGAVGKEVHHALQPGVVEAGHDGAAADLPRLQVRGDQPGAHDGLQDLRQDALVEGGGARAQDLLRRQRVRHHDERLRAERQLVDTAVLLEVTLQS